MPFMPQTYVSKLVSMKHKVLVSQKIPENLMPLGNYLIIEKGTSKYLQQKIAQKPQQNPPKAVEN